MKILITGATGFIGSQVVHELQNGNTTHEIRVLSRNPEKARSHFKSLPQITAFKWNPETEVAPATALEKVDAVLHLAGENLTSGRWNEETKRRIMDSRKLGTRNLVAGLNQMSTSPVFISTSAVGYYGSRGDEVLTEGSPPGTGFLSDVCQAWETEALLAKTPKLTIFRFGMVLAKGGGALEKILPIFKSGVGGRIGSGNHWMSWIDRRDLTDLLIKALSEAKTGDAFRGIYNAVAPEPVTNHEFTKTLGSVLHRPTLIPVPVMGLKLAFGEMAEEVMTASQRVIPQRLLSQGYSFRFPTLSASLASLMVEVPGS